MYVYYIITTTILITMLYFISYHNVLYYNLEISNTHTKGKVRRKKDTLPSIYNYYDDVMMVMMMTTM